MIRYLVLLGAGLCAGLLVSGGLISVLLAVGLIPRFAGKTDTGRKIFLYEEMVVLGAISGTLLSIFPGCERFGQTMSGMLPTGLWHAVGLILLAVYGIFAGIFIGALALAVAEMLDSIPIFARRIGFRHGIGIVVLAMALGKLCGSLYYFAGGWAKLIE